MQYSITSKKLSVEQANNFVEDVKENAYYVYAGGSDDALVLTTPVSSVKTDIDTYNSMIFGSKIADQNICLMIPKYIWEAGTVYAMYDDQDIDLYSKKFFVVVEDGTNYNVYKCLSNNNDSESTIEPAGRDETPYTSEIDGYTWKYLYTISTVNYDKFATDDYIPLIPNNAITDSAVKGGIEYIKVVEPGSSYDNYFPEFSFRDTDIKIGGDGTVYGLPDTASTANGFYKDCLVKVRSGLDIYYRTVVDYVVSNGTRKIFLDREFNNTVTTTDVIEIYPKVNVLDLGGTATSECIAMAVISANSGNSVGYVEVLNAGANYRHANAVLTPANSILLKEGFTPSVVRPIIAPRAGHGSDLATELGASYAGISVTFSTNQFIPEKNDYRQVGVIKNPLFSSVRITLNAANSVGIFLNAEEVHRYKEYEIAGTVVIQPGNNVVYGNGTDFRSFRVGDDVLITDGVTNTLTQIAHVANSLTCSVTSNVPTGYNQATIAKLETNYYGTVSTVDNSSVTLTNVDISDTLGDKNDFPGARFIGLTSFTTSQANTSANTPLLLNGRSSGNFLSFSQLQRLSGVQHSVSTFIEDEIVTQVNNVDGVVPSAQVHSYDASANTLYLNNCINTFNLNSSLSGNSSGAELTVASKFPGDLVQDSGKIVYTQNLNAISRTNTKQETVRLILEF